MNPWCVPARRGRQSFRTKGQMEGGRKGMEGGGCSCTTAMATVAVAVAGHRYVFMFMFMFMFIMWFISSAGMDLQKKIVQSYACCFVLFCLELTRIGSEQRTGAATTPMRLYQRATSPAATPAARAACRSVDPAARAAWAAQAPISGML